MSGVARSASRRKSASRGARRSKRGARRRRLALAAGFLLALLWLGWRFGAWILDAAVDEMRYRSHVQRVESQAEAIRFAARESRVDPNLLAAIMLAESGGRVDAVSRVGALGLFQLMLPTAIEQARALGLSDPSAGDLLSDPLLNARLAARYIAWLERRYDGHLEQMLIAYNAGPGRLARWLREAGGYPAWRAERQEAGNSDVLRYAAKVAHFREVFAERGVVAPLVELPRAPPAPHVEPPPSYGPPLPDEHEDGSTPALAGSA